MMFGHILKSCRPQSKKNHKGWQRFAKEVDFKDIKFPVKTRDIHKIKKKRIPSGLAFLIRKIRKNIQCMYQKNVAKTYY